MTSVQYHLESGDGTTSAVICIGQSLSGDQYVNASSAGEPVQFVLDVGEIAIIPNLTTVTTTSMTVWQHS